MWTKEKLAAKSVTERHQIYKNALKAKAQGDEKAEATLAIIEESGLPFSDGKHVQHDDPLVLKMFDIINSKDGTGRMLSAVDDGWPPLAGVDPLIAGALGVDYGAHNGTTNWAGQLVWERMRGLGYKKVVQKSMPKGCVARSATAVTK